MNKFLAILAIPLGFTDHWQILQFKNIKPNKVDFSTEKMVILVEESAGPIVYALEKPTIIRSLSAKGVLGSGLNLPAKIKQGEKSADDFALRIGVVVAGKKKLNWLQRKLAPDWILHLYKLAPKDLGIDRIEFVNLVKDPKLLGNHRRHPKNELLVENFATLAAAPGPFTLDFKFSAPIEAIAIWISADGDDTKSKFKIELNQLNLSLD